MKTKIEKFLKENYKNLSQEKIDDLTDKMCELLPSLTVKLLEIKVGETFRYNGYDFTKLANEEESCYCLLNDSVFESKFGETNDWAKSPIRKKLNEFDEQGDSEALPNINESDLVSVSLNYYAYKIPNGRTEDKITVPSWEEYIAYDFNPIDTDAWLRSGGNSSANLAYGLNSTGGDYGTLTGTTRAVRPALHLRKDLEVNK